MVSFATKQSALLATDRAGRGDSAQTQAFWTQLNPLQQKLAVWASQNPPVVIQQVPLPPQIVEEEVQQGIVVLQMAPAPLQVHTPSEHTLPPEQSALVQQPPFGIQVPLQGV